MEKNYRKFFKAILIHTLAVSTIIILFEATSIQRRVRPNATT